MKLSRIFLLLFTLASPLLTNAQYFGQNKVVYESFEFKVLKTAHFDIHYYLEDTQMIQDIAVMAERWHDRFSVLLRHELLERKPIIIYANHADFQQTNAITGFIDPGVQGVTEGIKNRLIMPLAPTYAETDHVLGHEMVHVFQYDIAASMAGVGLRGISMVPLWVIEGMAEYLSVGRNDPLTSQYLRDAMLRDELPTYKELNRKPYEYNPYHYGQAFWAYLGSRYGDSKVERFFKVSLFAGPDSAFTKVLGTTPNQFFSDWHTAIRQQYEPVLAERSVIKEEARLLLSEERKSGSMNISPVISPNGRYIAFVSEKDIFSVELYLANANNGRILKKLTKSFSASHFESLRFLSTAGGWSPDGNKFVFTALNNGRDELVIIDMDSRSIERQFFVEGVPALNDPSFSPDGKSILFSGSKEGVTDLYILNLASGNVKQLTDDRYADFHATFSPDGKNIAFVTDRGQGTSFQTLYFAPYSIALYNMESGEIKTLNIFNDANHINPQFTPDSSSLIFVADPLGFSEIYRYTFEGDSIHRLTGFKRGVTGITEISPAISVASRTGKLVFSALVDNNFNIYRLNEEELQGEPMERPAEPTQVAMLPLAEAEADVAVEKYINAPRMGLSADTGFVQAQYKPKFQLDYVGQAGVGVGMSSYGSALVGGIDALFSDLLGNHLIAASVQITGRLNDAAGQLIYYNLKHRLQYGASFIHVPTFYVQGGFQGVNPDGVPFIQYNLLRLNYDRLAPSFIFPLSQSKRFEFEAGIAKYGLSSQTYYEDALGRREYLKDTTSATASVWAAEPSIAFVHDNTAFGFTSPVRGSRYRLEFTPSFNSLTQKFQDQKLTETGTFYTYLADFRKYFFLRPLTFAFRGMHYGRYGNLESTVFNSTLFLGNPVLIRGYNYASFETREITEGDPIVLDRLFGSRLAIGNFEVRLPVLGTKRYGLINLPYVPLELAGFVDAGLAWSENHKPEIKQLGLEYDPNDDFSTVQEGRVPVFSTGLAARANLFGYIVLQVYYAYPFQRELKGGHFGIAISPGW